MSPPTRGPVGVLHNLDAPHSARNIFLGVLAVVLVFGAVVLAKDRTNNCPSVLDFARDFTGRHNCDVHVSERTVDALGALGAGFITAIGIVSSSQPQRLSTTNGRSPRRRSRIIGGVTSGAVFVGSHFVSLIVAGLAHTSFVESAQLRPSIVLPAVAVWLVVGAGLLRASAGSVLAAATGLAATVLIAYEGHRVWSYNSA